jgi:hypothetical protein
MSACNSFSINFGAWMPLYRHPALAVGRKLGYNTAIFPVREPCPDLNKNRKNRKLDCFSGF